MEAVFGVLKGRPVGVVSCQNKHKFCLRVIWLLLDLAAVSGLASSLARCKQTILIVCRQAVVCFRFYIWQQCLAKERWNIFATARGKRYIEHRRVFVCVLCCKYVNSRCQQEGVWLEFWVSLSCLLASVVLTPQDSVSEFTALLCVARLLLVFAHFQFLILFANGPRAFSTSLITRCKYLLLRLIYCIPLQYSICWLWLVELVLNTCFIMTF